MPPNTIDLPVRPDPEMMINGVNKPMDQAPLYQESDGKYALRVVQSSFNLLAHILIGCLVTVAIMFGFRLGMPLNATSRHMVLCIIGYKMLMAEAILSMTSENGWSSRLTLVHRKRAHWILQIVGSGLAIAGSFHKMFDKTEHWTTLHGKFALVALVFTVVCFVNGLASLWAYEVRRCIPGNLSKITHICFGIVAYTAASIALCYGFDKGNFRNWSTSAMANTFIGFVITLLFIVITNPLITLFRRTKTVFKRS